MRIAVLILLLALTPAERQRNIDSFEHVWKTVRDRHWDPKLNGVDWAAAHEQLRPRIEKAESMETARAVMEDLLGRLKQSHFGIIPAETYQHIEGGQGSREATPGLDVRPIDGRVLVTSVDKDSPAAGAGIRPGWEVLAIDANDLGPVLARIARVFDHSTLRPLMVRAAVLRRLSGPAGSSVKLKLRDGAGRAVEIVAPRVKPRGLKVEFGFLPPIYVWAEWRKLGGDAASVAFNAFMDAEGIMKAAGEAVAACAECAGMVVDLRGNPGGIAGMAMGLAGFFVEEKGRRLGAMYTRDTTLNFVVFPRLAVFGGKLAVLVDGSTGSTAEIFAGGMKDLKRARIFGSRTAGAALPSAIEKLPNGDGFQFAFANYVSEGGHPLEGAGVTPDVAVEPTRESLLAGRDLVLDAALAWIREPK